VQLDALSADDYLESPLFGEREKAVIRWAELVTWNKARYDDEAFLQLSKHFDSTEIVELTTVAAFRGLMNRFMDSLHIELEGPELEARGGRAAASQEDLHAYIEKLLNLV
jgi:alkylhydroperoxidase family enzyme